MCSYYLITKTSKVTFATETERREWWKFAFNALKRDFDGKHFTWDQIEFNKKQREEYMPLFKRSLKVPWLKSLSTAETERLKKLEEEIDFDSIVVYRELAREQVQTEKRERDRQFSLQMQQRASPQKPTTPAPTPSPQKYVSPTLFINYLEKQVGSPDSRKKIPLLRNTLMMNYQCLIARICP
jgi:phage FluMu gp28-like protein